MARDNPVTWKARPMKTDVTILRSKLWPNIHARVWRVGNVWFTKCGADTFPQGAKIETFRTRDDALAHVKIVLAL